MFVLQAPDVLTECSSTCYLIADKSKRHSWAWPLYLQHPLHYQEMYCARNLRHCAAPHVHRLSRGLTSLHPQHIWSAPIGNTALRTNKFSSCSFAPPRLKPKHKEDAVVVHVEMRRRRRRVVNRQD